jgi:hypothetical protein
MRKNDLLILLMLLIAATGYGQVTDNPLANVSLDYAKYNLNTSNVPEKWEDGMRTDGGKGSYEWWYFDSHLDDGSTVVMIFYTKPFVNLNKDLTPFITMEIDRPDGTSIKKRYFGAVEEFSSAKDSCNVVIGKNYFRGNLKQYEIHFEDDELNITATVERTTESWRPKTGHIVFGADKTDYFAWVVSVPQGKTEIEYTYRNEKTTAKGSCYHDHNWGNKSILKAFNHWYWSRAEIGPYNVIASEMIAEKEYDSQNIVVFNVSKDGKTVVDDGSKVTMYQTYGKIHPTLKKDVSDDIVFIYDNPNDIFRYEYYLYREKNLLEVDLLEASIESKFKRRLARLLTDFDGAYFRMTGRAEIRVFKDNVLIETHKSSTAVWELMYFGKVGQ